MTLYADDPDVHVVIPVANNAGEDVDFTPVVRVAGFPDINAAWVGAPAPTRELRVPLTGLPAGATHSLRLVVPSDNDVDLGTVILK